MSRRMSLLLVLAMVAGSFAITGRAASASSTHRGIDTAGFQPLSLTFLSAERGWALGTAPCAPGGACLVLLETSDFGARWTPVHLPSALVDGIERDARGSQSTLASLADLQVRFANATDGWVYGTLEVPDAEVGSSDVTPEPVLFSTHDGGLRWVRQRLAWVNRFVGAIYDVEAAGGSVFMAALNRSYRVTVERSPLDVDQWHIANTVALFSPAGGAIPSGSIVLKGSSGWLVEGNDRGTSGSARLDRRGSWVRWTPPCARVGSSFSVPAASTPLDLVAACTMGGFAMGLSKSAPPGATLGSTWLYFSLNAGATFTAGPELRFAKPFAFGGVLGAPRPDVVLIDRYVGAAEDLAVSIDRGLSWHVAYRGQVLSVEFPTPTAGVGLVRSASERSTSMIESTDDGQHWTHVSF
jgi:hypothetical protein